LYHNLSSPKVSSDQAIRTLLRWGLYPTSWLVIITLFSTAVVGGLELRQAWAIGAGILFVSYILLETAFPYERRWEMTRSSFLLI
jgi:hypothetical protein